MPIIVTPSGSTAQTLIERAMRLIGQLQSGESASFAELSDCLTALNAMLSSWRLERLMVFALQTESIGLNAGTSSLAIGPSGTYVTTTPLRIEDAYATYNGVDTQVYVVQAPEWDAIPLKTVTSTIPQKLYYEPTQPNGTIKLYPVNSATFTLNLLTRVPLAGYASVSDVASLPPGWDDAIVYNLAIRIAPEYEKQVSAEVVGIARDTKAAIRTINTRPMRPSRELIGFNNRRTFNINTGL